MCVCTCVYISLLSACSIKSLANKLYKEIVYNFIDWKVWSKVKVSSSSYFFYDFVSFSFISDILFVWHTSLQRQNSLTHTQEILRQTINSFKYVKWEVMQKNFVYSSSSASESHHEEWDKVYRGICCTICVNKWKKKIFWLSIKCRDNNHDNILA